MTTTRLRVLLTVFCLACAGSGSAAATSDTGSASSVLVLSRVPLTQEIVAALSAQGLQVRHVWPEINALAMSVPASKLDALAANPWVELLEADQGGSVDGAPITPTVDSAAPPAYPMPLFNGPGSIETWNQSMSRTAGTGFDGTGVTVAVVDSGLPQNWTEFLPPGSVDLEHAAGFGAEGWGDFHSQVNVKPGVGGHTGLLPHGLAVASVIVGFPSPFGPIGGAAPGAKILPIQVLNQFNFGWSSWFTAGILHVARLKASGALPGPVVINFSIQLRGDSVILGDAIDYAISQGVLFVTIAGNFGPAPGSISFPGRLPQSITAGAVGWTHEFATPQWFFDPVPANDPAQVYVTGFSGREFPGDPPASRVDVLAPGAFVFGEWPYGPGFSEGHTASRDAIDYFIFGTSFACPHVAGITAQMLQKNPGLTQAEAESILRGSALPIPALAGAWGADATGAGLARGSAAVAATPAP